MTPVDAMWLWFATKFSTDQFLLYAFDGTTDPAAAAEQVAQRATACPQLCRRIRERSVTLGYPLWVPTEVASQQVTVTELAMPTWSQCLAEVSRLMDHQLDPRRFAWRVHLFTALVDVPGATGPATVAVLQISHALADGVRSSAFAGYLLGRDHVPPAPSPRHRQPVIPAAIDAYRRRRELARDVERGTTPGPRQLVTPLSTNENPGGPRSLRTVLTSRSQLPSTTVTVGVLAAVSEALAGYLVDRGESVASLTAAVPVLRTGSRTANNFFDTVMVGLHPDAPSLQERLSRIGADFEERRRARLHPAFAATDRAFDSVPAPLRRLGVRRLNTERRPESVVAHTVVSSVNRGPADLSLGALGEGSAIFTSGYPELLPICGLTHGVHGIGDTVAISVHASDSAVPEVDAYVDRLEFALSAVAPRVPRDGARSTGTRDRVVIV